VAVDEAAEAVCAVRRELQAHLEGRKGMEGSRKRHLQRRKGNRLRSGGVQAVVIQAELEVLIGWGIYRARPLDFS
jgi:hypothetical protein